MGEAYIIFQACLKKDNEYPYKDCLATYASNHWGEG